MRPKKNLEPLRNNRPSLKIRSIAFALLILGVAACNAFSRGSGGSDPFARFRVVVQADNQGFLDMNVFAVRLSPNSGSAQSPGGVYRVRLGTAPGNSQTNFTVPGSLLSDCRVSACVNLTSLRFLAVPIGSLRAPAIQEITVVPGDTAVLTIPPV
jgi:hypothetical protein